METKIYQNKNLILIFSVIATFLASPLLSIANNCSVNNVERLASDKSMISFDISWENSWSAGGAPKNHDAVWVFIKFLECTGTSVEWDHALLSKNMSDHSVASGIAFCRQIDTVDRHGNSGNFNTGVLIKRAEIGFGHVVSQKCTLKIVGSSSDTVFSDSRDYEIRVFAIEMVQVKKGSFSVGDGASNANNNNPGNVCSKGSLGRLAHRNISNFDEPYTVISEDSIATDDALKLRDTDSGSDIYVPAKWPKGFSEFYIMKYEISQGQYGDFLNTLISGGNRVPGEYGNSRHTLTVTADGDFGSDNPNRACNFLSYDDVLSYLDWAALRPMTEFEYEKSCRGPAGSTIKEYAWGNTNIYYVTSVSSPEDGTDTTDAWSSGTHANINNMYYAVDGTKGPVGVGIFARDHTQNREATGGSYYGAMELSGNVAETTIAVSMNGYQGIWGDGMLGSGKHNTPDWPTNPNARVVGLYRSFSRASKYTGGSYCWCWEDISLTVSYRETFYDCVYTSGGDIYAPQPHVRDKRVGGRGAR